MPAPTTWLGALRQPNAREPLFDGTHRLHRLAWRFKSYPTDVADAQTSRKRWYFLLRSNKSSNALSDTNRTDIRSALNNVMNDSTILQVLFQTVHDGSINTRFEVASSVGDEPDIPNDPTGHTLVNTLTLTLKCQLDQLIPKKPNELDPPTKDATERPPQVIA